jgi:hypothetical protein
VGVVLGVGVDDSLGVGLGVGDGLAVGVELGVGLGVGLQLPEPWPQQGVGLWLGDP